MGTPISNQDMVLMPDDTTVVAVITKTGTPSNKVKTGNVGVTVDGYSLSVASITVPSQGATIPDPVSYSVSLNSSAKKVKVDGELVLLEGDVSGTINATPQIPGTPPIDYPVSFKIKISSSGQTKVMAI